MSRLANPSRGSESPPDATTIHRAAYGWDAPPLLFEPVGTPDNLDLLVLLQAVARTIRKRWEKELRARIPGLSATRVSSLLELGRGGGMTQAQLAGLLGVSQMAMSQLLDDLESRAWVLREPVPADRRAWAIRLTHEGRQALNIFQAMGRAFADRSCAALDEDQRLALARMLLVLANGTTGAPAETRRSHAFGVGANEA